MYRIIQPQPILSPSVVPDPTLMVIQDASPTKVNTDNVAPPKVPMSSPSSSVAPKIKSNFSTDVPYEHPPNIVIPTKTIYVPIMAPLSHLIMHNSLFPDALTQSSLPNTNITYFTTENLSSHHITPFEPFYIQGRG